MSFKKIDKIVNKERKDIMQMALKLSEETGELSEAILSLTQASGSKYKNLGYADALEECVDVILISYALFQKLNEETDYAFDFNDILDTKISKWLKKIDD